jgi:hypothetical protein
VLDLEQRDLESRKQAFLYYSPRYTGQMRAEMQIREGDLAELYHIHEEMNFGKRILVSYSAIDNLMKNSDQVYFVNDVQGEA